MRPRSRRAGAGHEPRPFDGSHAPSPLRAALGRFATGVTIVTCRDAAGVAAGLTVNSFSALSLEPPLVLWSLRVESPSLPSFRAARHFAVNVLAEDQLDLARRFATGSAHKFDAGRWSPGQTGAPVLAGALAVLECERESRTSRATTCSSSARCITSPRMQGLHCCSRPVAIGAWATRCRDNPGDRRVT